MTKGIEKDYNSDVLNIELELLLEAIYRRYGYDFRNYSKAHVKRRILHHLIEANVNSVSELQAKVLYNKKCF